jgi:hypothetical protein
VLSFLKGHTRSFSAEAPPCEIIVFKVFEVAQDRLPNVEIPRAPGSLGEQIQAFFYVHGEPHSKHESLPAISSRV